MGCNCSSDYSDSEWIENLDEICDHCNCPIGPQSGNTVSDSGKIDAFISASVLKMRCQFVASVNEEKNTWTMWFVIFIFMNYCNSRCIVCVCVCSHRYVLSFFAVSWWFSVHESYSFKGTWNLEMIFLRSSENWSCFSCCQYTNQLIPYPSQHSPPTSPLPGSNSNNNTVAITLETHTLSVFLFVCFLTKSIYIHM